MKPFNFIQYIKNNPLLKENVNEAPEATIPQELTNLGVNFTRQPADEENAEGYNSVESYSTTIPGLGGDSYPGEDELFINVYNGDSFCFFYDSAPIPTPLHSQSDIERMASTQIEVPVPISKLNKVVFDSVVNKIKEMNY